jgi:hypothetical protein
MAGRSPHAVGALYERPIFLESRKYGRSQTAPTVSTQFLHSFTARHSRNQRELTAETQRKIRNQIALRTPPSLQPTSTSGALMFGFTCFVRLLTEQKLKVLCVSAVNSPFPRVLQRRQRTQRKSFAKNQETRH